MKLPAKVDSWEEVDLGERPVHLAIGMFDGVHLGHQSVIEAAVHSARSRSGVAGVLTFWPHPSVLFQPDNPTRLIMDPAGKTRLFFSLGAELVVEQPFDSTFARLPAESFLTYLLERLPRLDSVYVGENWRFGRGRKGDVALLIEDSRRHGVNVVSMPRLHFNGEAISSSRIRKALTQGRMEEVNVLLGYHYFTQGLVCPGRRLGTRIGFPTLNIRWTGDLSPRYGVYGVRVSGASDLDSIKTSGSSEHRTFQGIANFGIRPTVEDNFEADPVLEVHLLAEDCPFHVDDELQIEWLFFLRPESRFDNVAALKEQIARDLDEAVLRFREL